MTENLNLTTFKDSRGINSANSEANQPTPLILFDSEASELCVSLR